MDKLPLFTLKTGVDALHIPSVWEKSCSRHDTNMHRQKTNSSMSRFEAFDKKLNVVVKIIYLMIRQKILFEEGHTGTSVSLSATTNGRVPPDAIDLSRLSVVVLRDSLNAKCVNSNPP